MKNDYIKLENICFGYGNTPVIENFNLEIEEGSFTTFLGSSGCGKTTLLRLISGFLEPQNGKIIINDEVQNSILPDKRKIGMVFQNYALFPHMTVEQNLLYGLKLKKADKKEKAAFNDVVIKTAETLGIEKLLNRYPHELSGGQQQRVALGRSLVLEPKVLLMDEPLSSLDANLRGKVREELKEIQKKLGITTVYVTHDQEEAFFLSDKIAVFNEGKVLQYGSGNQLYFEPANAFVAEFVGGANFILQQDKTKVVRPEWIEIIDNGASDFSGTVISADFLGDTTRFKIQVAELNQELVVHKKTLECQNINCGQNVKIKILRDWPL